MKKLIVFDFDGVLIDSFSVVLSMLQKLHKEYCLPAIDEEILKKYFEQNFWDNYKTLFDSKEDLEKFKQSVGHTLSKEIPNLHFFPTIPEVLEKLSQEASLAIITSNSEPVVRKILQKEKLENIFSYILGVETPGDKQEKISSLQHDFSSIFFVTDTLGDVREVESLPLQTIAVTWGYHSRERLASSSANHIIHTPSELLDII